MKKYLTPEVELIAFAAESITSVSMGNGDDDDPEDMD